MMNENKENETHSEEVQEDAYDLNLGNSTTPFTRYRNIKKVERAIELLNPNKSNAKQMLAAIDKGILDYDLNNPSLQYTLSAASLKMLNEKREKI